VARTQAGDRGALETLLRRHHPRMHAACRRLLGNDSDADDAAQEALLSIVRGIDRFDGRSRFSTWAYRIAVNASLDEIRRRGRRPEPHDDEVLATGAVVHSRSGPSPDDVAGRVDIDTALAQLSPEFRAAVVLRDLCQLDYEEIAEILSIPPGTVRSRIARGRSALASIVGNPSTGADRPTQEP
jgi:RNA polymerase sigma-70 factor (ECF subfamily)